VSAGAVRIADRSGDPIAPELGSGGQNQAAKDPAVIESSAAANPGGGPPWVVRAYTTGTGRECIQVGRLRGGRFGQVQAGRFRALPASAAGGSCAPAGAPEPQVAVSMWPLLNLVVVFGLGVDPSPVSVSFGTQHRRVKPGGFGAFIAVFEGSGRDQPIVVRSRVGGRLHVRRF
jgi:hypothetical protein